MLAFFDILCENSAHPGFISIPSISVANRRHEFINVVKYWIPKIIETGNKTEKIQTLELHIFRIENIFK